MKFARGESHLHTETVKASSACLPNKADMFWKSRSSSGVMAGLFSNVTSLRRDGRRNNNRKMWNTIYKRFLVSEGKKRKETKDRCDKHNKGNAKLERTNTVASQGSRVGVKGKLEKQDRRKGSRSTQWKEPTEDFMIIYLPKHDKMIHVNGP